MTKYALFSYTTGNIGDEIQSVAASRFLPQIDYYVNRDYLNEFQYDGEESIKLIMNGWYSHRPENFPLKNEKIDPLLISMFIDEPVQEQFSTEENRAFFKKYGPVGARSGATKDFLESIGVDSYWSGCLTLTIQPEKNVKKQDFVLAIDLPNAVFDKLAKESTYPVIRMSADINHQYMTPTRRMKVAQYYLYLYQSARFVVTTRLHGTLPCLALGTPVLNIQEKGFEEGRFAGLRELAHHMTVEDFLSGTYDVNHPLSNPQKHLEIRKQLEERCQAFTGFKNEEGFLNGREVSELLLNPELVQSMVTGLWSAHQYYGIYR
ncbi:polysaccharide pyruvyl transferase family protein [Streptococcus suis]|nr:polysaccharide pyruvyl transferase family protein [Streptococcus suis]